jgi:hypothetical protein
MKSHDEFKAKLSRRLSWSLTPKKMLHVCTKKQNHVRQVKGIERSTFLLRRRICPRKWRGFEGSGMLTMFLCSCQKAENT